MSGLALAFLAAVLLGAYLLGSIPFAIVVSRTMGLEDPRSFGSKNPGATNVLRTGNRTAAALTLIGDASKGAVAVLICQALCARWGPVGLLAYDTPAWAGAAAFLGHLYPIFIGFRGGKGVATFLGTLLALNPLVGVATCVLWVVIAVWLRYSSAASIMSAMGAALALFTVPASTGTRVAVVIMCALLVWRHRKNIVQLLSGTESKIGQAR